MFQPTRPVRGVTDHATKAADLDEFQPTRPVRGVTYCWQGSRCQGRRVSTHTPRAGRDSVY